MPAWSAISPWAPNLLAALLYAVSGLCLFFFVVSRFFFRLIDSRLKFFAMGITFLFMTGGPFVGGWIAGFSEWVLLPAAAFLAAGIGEAYRLLLLRRHRADPPVERENARVSLLRPFTTTRLVVTRYRLSCPHWPGRRLRVVLISDLHVTDRLPLAYYQSVMARVAEQAPDLLLIAGDFVSRPRFVPLLPGILCGARGRLGTFAVLGNHDVWTGIDDVVAHVRQAGVRFLDDESIRFSHDGAPVLLCGCEMPWPRRDWCPPRAQPGELTLGLTHTGDNIYRMSEAGLNAVFAGHYHGGQFRLPWFGPLVVPSIYGRRFVHGHFRVKDTHLFVSAGLGASQPPLRVFCHPDLFVIDIEGSAATGQNR